MNAVHVTRRVCVKQGMENGASVPECPFCKTVILASAVRTLTQDTNEQYDVASIDAQAQRNAATARVLHDTNTSGVRENAIRASVSRVVESALCRLNEASAPRAAEHALAEVYQALLCVRRAADAVVAVISDALDHRVSADIASAMLMHPGDAAVQRAGVDALCVATVASTRRPQRALALALATHGADQHLAVALSNAVVRYTYKHLSRDSRARCIAQNLADVVVKHAPASLLSSMYALMALMSVIPHLCQAEVVALKSVTGLSAAARTVYQQYAATHGEDTFARSVQAFVRCMDVKV